MKLSRFTSLVLAATLTLPVVAHAQIVPMHFDGVKTAGGDAVGGAATGAYVAHATPAGSPFDIFCVDYDHTAQTTWTAHYVTFTEATTAGIIGSAANRQLGTDKAWGIQQLRAAAYLTTQFGAVGAGLADDNWDDVHGAIWSMFSNNAAPNAFTGMVANAITVAGNNSFWDDNYSLLLDDRAFNSDIPASQLNQAFITMDGGTHGNTVTPETGTYALMGAGLMVVGFVRRRRAKA
ncbi:MAG: PEP-CTERM sorting domain-containing protein [Gemmatimonadaceae bacterium]